jgi:hypothetical protein
MSRPSLIASLDAFDVVGVRNDGGIDLVISCFASLDSSENTLRDLRAKISNYIREIREARNPTLFERYECSPSAKVRIIISCELPVPAKALEVVEDMRKVAAKINVDLLVQDRT